MATEYPEALDQYAPVPGNQNQIVKHRDRHQNIEDAIEAIEATVGVTGSTDPNSIQYRLNNVPTNAAIAGPNGSDLVGFTQAGSGSVARTAQDKMRERITPQDFGAVGDGVTNDTAAINAAIAALASSSSGIPVLEFPSGRYLTDGGHVITVPCVIRGAGFGTIPPLVNGASVLALRAGANADMLTIAHTHVTIEDLGLYGNKGNQSATSHGLRTSTSIASNYFRINRVWVDAFRDDGMRFQGPGTSLEGMAHQCRVSNCGTVGYNFVDGASSDCQLTDCVSSINNTGVQVNAGSIILSGCHIWGNLAQGVFMPSGAGGYLRMIGCYVETNGTLGIVPRGAGNQIIGCYVWKNQAAGIYAFSNSYMTISGCTIRDNNRNNAAGAIGAGINLDTCTACTTTGNTMYDTGGAKFQSYGYAETGNTCTACLFSGNVSRAADHKTGNWLIGASATPTIPATPASFNVG